MEDMASRMFKAMFRLLKKMYKEIKCFYLKRHEVKKINQKNRKKIYSKVVLSRNQITQTQMFFKKHYGKKISLKWHKEYYAISGKFDYRFFPEYLYIPAYERLSNSPKYFECFQDKNVTSLFLKSVDFVKDVEVYIRCMNGVLYDSNFDIIKLDDAVKLLSDKKNFFIKLSVDSNSGRGCRICHILDGVDVDTGDKIIDILHSFGKNYIVQKIVVNSFKLKQLNPTSLNTFRVITYLLDGKIYHTPTILRIGRMGNFLDNAHAGGIFIGVDDSGNLLDTAFTEFGDRYDKHPDTQILFKGYCVEEFPRILEVAHKLQSLFPQVRIIHWDLTIDENNDIVLIEANMRGGGIWLPQMAHGKSPFGDNTARILEIIRKNKNLY